MCILANSSYILPYIENYLGFKANYCKFKYIN